MHRIILEFGPFTVYSYGVMLAVAFLISSFLAVRQAPRYGFSNNEVLDSLVVFLVSGIIGARILHVVLNWREYSGDFLGIIKINEGGLAIQGGMLSAVLAGVIFCRIRKISFLKIADLTAPYVALGQAIGRIGCFLNGCCYGAAATGWMGVTFPGEGFPRLPAQLIYSFAMLMIFLLLAMLRGKKYPAGSIFASYIVFYSGFRFFMDFLRNDNPVFCSGLTAGQIISVGMLILGIILYEILKWKK